MKSTASPRYILTLIEHSTCSDTLHAPPQVFSVTEIAMADSIVSIVIVHVNEEAGDQKHCVVLLRITQ